MCVILNLGTMWTWITFNPLANSVSQVIRHLGQTISPGQPDLGQCDKPFWLPWPHNSNKVKKNERVGLEENDKILHSWCVTEKRREERTARPPGSKYRHNIAQPESEDQTERKVFTEKSQNKVRERGITARQRDGGIKWTAHKRRGRTGKDRGIPWWHLISLFLALLLPISLLFCPNKSFWLLLNQLIPSRQQENCNNLTPIYLFSLFLPISFPVWPLSNTHLRCRVFAMEVMVGTNYLTLLLQNRAAAFISNQ